MTIVYLCLGIALGIIIGALVQEKIHADKNTPSDLDRLFKQACDELQPNEVVSITLSGSKDIITDGDGGDVLLDTLSPEASVDSWRDN